MVSVAALMLATGARGDTTRGSPLVVESLTYTHPNELVRVEGARRLNMLCLGQGAPVVMLVNGGDSNTMAWQKTQPLIAEFSRVCTYDKAGFGFSDAATHPSSVSHDVDDLRRLIDAAKIRVPVVLVGESLGGEDAVLFSGRHRDAVAGMVLADPTVGLRGILASFSPKELAQFGEGVRGTLADFAQCVKLAKAERLNRTTSKFADKFDCLDNDYAGDPVLQVELDRQEMQAKNQAAQLSEMENHYPLMFTRPADAHGMLDSENDREMEGASTNFGDMPLIVLSADPDNDGAGGNCAGDRRCIANRALVNAAHSRIARYSTRGKSIVVEGATHDILNSRPDAVVDAVREVVRQVRKRR